MTKTSALEALSRLGPVSRLFWKSDDLARGERFALYVRDDQIIAFLYRLTNGRPTGVANIYRVTAADFIAADARTDAGDCEPALQRLGTETNRTYKVIKTFHFGRDIHLLLEQTIGRHDAIVVGEVSEEEGGQKTIALKARVEPQQLIKSMKIAS